MNIQTFYPEAPTLKKHIEYYYFLKTNSENFSEEYYSFPNTNHSFNIHKNVRFEFGLNYAYVCESNTNNYLNIVQGKYDKPLFVHLKGRLDKLTIVFKPLGFNHFIDTSFSSVAGKPSQIFTNWQTDTAYISFIKAFYGTIDNIKKVKLVERFLLSKYHECNHYSVLKYVIEQLTDFDAEYSIEEIVASTGMNARSFNRLFYQEIGISPVGFRKIARFRHSLKNKLFNDQFKKLTEIGYASNFYDQSYFIKMYKMLTSQTPSAFFRSINKLANNQLILKFIHQ